MKSAEAKKKDEKGFEGLLLLKSSHIIAALTEPQEAEADPLQAALAEVNADTLSPRDALDLIYRLKRLASEAEGA